MPTRIVTLLLILSASLAVLPEAWADTKLTVLFSGDNSGEIGPCG